MRNMLGFIVDANDGAFVPGKNIQHIELVSNTSVKVHFSGDDGTSGSAVLTVTTDKADEVAREIARVAVSASGVVTVADSLNSVFAHADISAVASYSVQ